MTNMKVNMSKLVLCLSLIGSALAVAGCGCGGDANSDDKSPRLAPPANAPTGQGPMEAGAAEKAKRKGLHFQNSQGEGGGGETGDGK